MRVATIHLYADPEQEQYHGCYWVPDEDDPEINAVLDACNVGKWVGEDGVICRPFFTAAEIDQRLDEAHRLASYVDVTWENYSLVGAS